MAESEHLLSPDELQALAFGVESGAIEVDTGVNLGAKVIKHDLAAEDSSLGINVSSLDMIDERFIRLFRLGMLEVLRTSPRINPAGVEIVRFGDYLKRLKSPLSVNIVRMQPLRGTTMVVIEPSLVFSSLDSFFGGFGRGVGQLPSGRLFTPTESRIIKLILNVFFRSMKEAWSPVMPVDFDVLSSEINPQFAQIADENDLVVVSRFDSEGNEDAKGFIDMVYPYNALKPLRDVFRSRLQISDTSQESDRVWADELNVAVKDSSLGARVVLGELTLSMASFEAMQEGDVIPFKKPDFARLIVNDVPVFEGQIGNLDTQVAMRMERPVRLQPVTHTQEGSR